MGTETYITKNRYLHDNGTIYSLLSDDCGKKSVFLEKLEIRIKKL